MGAPIAMRLDWRVGETSPYDAGATFTPHPQREPTTREKGGADAIRTELLDTL
jgi:hypothetical protein